MRWQVDGLTEQMDTEYGPLCMVYKLSQSRPGEQQGVGGGGKVEKSKDKVQEGSFKENLILCIWLL